MSKGLYYLPNISYLRSRNAGFDPAVIRVDTYGNVLYYHADSASPLAWEIDHWFPCSSTYFPFLSYFITLFLWLHLLRCNGFVGGGLTVPSNLRIIVFHNILWSQRSNLALLLLLLLYLEGTLMIPHRL